MDVSTDTANSAEIQSVLARYPDATEDQLITLLQEVQDACGYLSRDAILSIGRHIDMPASRIYGVATFYNQFRFYPLGRVHIQICRGTACHVKGSKAVLDTLQGELGVGANQTTRDGVFSFEELACIGACGLAPAIMVNGELRAKVTPESIPGLLKEYREKVEAV
ncbi:MAG: NADH-quinone oxidoreductase subunit NuoE [Planctomycetota bacterium]|jgi:NADH:ubiquinone oxidoreductase subunit E|nr:NADH-quinone oxidoreductase subunit NuoE [Planctomycetota bacterium]